MTTITETVAFHRAAIAFHENEIARLEGSPIPSAFDPGDWRTWWPAMQEQAANNRKPHEWVDLAAGTGGQAGDNDVPDEALLRAFWPFIQAIANTADPIQTDSTGERWSLQTIKKRAGIGPKSWGVVRDEIRGAWFTPWAVAWRANAANAPLVPKPEVVDALFSKVYG